MATDEWEPKFKLASSAPDFTLVSGGALLQRLLRGRLSDDQLKRIRKNLIFIYSLIAWLPLLALTALNGTLSGGGTAVPFLSDLEVHVRLLLALPLLIAAEFEMDRYMRPLVREFDERELIPMAARSRFDAAVASAIRRSHSVTAEVILIAFVYLFGILFIWQHYVALDAATWYATPSAYGPELSLAGTWYAYVSLPIFQFLLCRWYYWLYVWARFLWQVSRIKLALVPAHPDGLGGISFLSHTTRAFSAFAAAHGALLAGYLATRVASLGFPLTQFKAEIALMVVFVLCVTLIPLLVFAPQLRRARRKGLRQYGMLAGQYVKEFDTKWLRPRTVREQPLLGSSDIQSLADLGNGYKMVHTMRIVPVTRDIVTQLTVMTLAPVLPLMLTMMSLAELAQKLAKILL